MTRKIKSFDEKICIFDMEFPNKGIGLFNNEKVFIKNVIPGQKVLAKIKRKKNKYEGMLLEVLEKANYEVDPKCNFFDQCGGCTYQNLNYSKELEFKKNTVLKILKSNNIKNFEFLGIKASPLENFYRNKMEFSFGDTGDLNELSLGMKKRNSYYEVVNASNCNIVNSDINKVLDCVLNFFKNSNETFYHRKNRTGSLRHLLVRQAHFTGEMLVNIVTTDSISVNLAPLKEELLNLDLNGKIVGISQIINNSISDVVKADKINTLFGRDYFYEKILGLNFKISTFSFFQTNSAGAEVLYTEVLKLAEESKNEIVFDLYCGTGTIAQILSKCSKKVIGIEIVEEAIEAARENTKLNNISNVEFISGDVLKMVDILTDSPDLIILDPPREGIHPKAINKIVNFKAKRVIYISCKASSLAKDLTVFIENGYSVDKILCVDMFPKTYHVETVVLMTKINNS